MPAFSPYGTLIACSYQEMPTARWQIALIPPEGGPCLTTFALPRTVDLPSHICWTPDGQSIIYVDTCAGVSNLWRQPVDGGAPQQITDLKSNQIVWFAASTDCKELVLSLSSVISDVVLISGLRGTWAHHI